MNKLLKTKDVDYVIASDTDSIYVEMKELVDRVFADQTDKTKIVDSLDKFIQQKVESYIENCYKDLSVYMNSNLQKMKMKREIIAETAIWRKKKMYIMAAWDIEGVRYSEPLIKISGVEAIRSSTPHVCREALEKMYKIFLQGTEKELIESISKFKEEHSKMPFEKIAKPSGVKGLKKYSDPVKLYKLGTPIHVKGALIYNDMVKRKKLENVLPMINEGDKIRFAYLKMPNPSYDTVIAAPDELPKELGLDKYINVEEQFNKTFLEPVRSFAAVKGWDIERRASLDDFFS
jgi:hypothetical protein